MSLFFMQPNKFKYYNFSLFFLSHSLFDKLKSYVSLKIKIKRENYYAYWYKLGRKISNKEKNLCAPFFCFSNSDIYIEIDE